jgi:hypothetical protein
MAEIPVISFKTQEGITSQRNKSAITDPLTYGRWDQVPTMSKHPLSTGHTCREPSFISMKVELSPVKVGVQSNYWYEKCQTTYGSCTILFHLHNLYLFFAHYSCSSVIMRYLSSWFGILTDRETKNADQKQCLQICFKMLTYCNLDIGYSTRKNFWIKGVGLDSEIFLQ